MGEFTGDRSIARLSALAMTVFACGCASDGPRTLAGEPVGNVLAAVQQGDARLTCGVGCSAAWGAGRRKARNLHENELWKDLAVHVAGVGFNGDITYFYLGRATEGMGYPEVANTYYRLALASPYKCDGLINNCDGLNVPAEARAGLARLAAGERRGQPK